MLVVYSIRDWDDTFECSQSRKVTGPLAWVAMPTKHDGKNFRKIMTRTDGLVIFAAWILIVEVAAKCPHRGVLADADGPLTAADLSLKTGAPTESFETALKVLSSKDLGWMLVAEWESSTATGQDRTGQNRTEAPASAGASAEVALKQPAAAMSEFVFPTSGKGAKEWVLPQAKLDEYIDAYPGLDVLTELRKARQWCRDNERDRKTAGGMLSFLTRWLNREQNSGRGRRGSTNGDDPRGNKGAAERFLNRHRGK